MLTLAAPTIYYILSMIINGFSTANFIFASIIGLTMLGLFLTKSPVMVVLAIIEAFLTRSWIIVIIGWFFFAEWKGVNFHWKRYISDGTIDSVYFESVQNKNIDDKTKIIFILSLVFVFIYNVISLSMIA